MIMPLLATLFACGGDLIVTPSTLDFGTVDVHGDMPDMGYSALQLTVLNETGRPQNLALEGFNSDRFVLGAFTVTDSPPTLDTLDDGDQAVLTIGVRGYETGERDTEVSGHFTLIAPELREPVLIDWSYTPTRVMNSEGS